MRFKYPEKTWIMFGKNISLRNQFKIFDFFDDNILIFNDRICTSFQNYYGAYKKMPRWLRQYVVSEYDSANNSIKSHIYPEDYKHGVALKYGFHPLVLQLYYDPIQKDLISFNCDKNRETINYIRTPIKDLISRFAIKWIKSGVTSSDEEYAMLLLINRGYINLADEMADSFITLK